MRVIVLFFISTIILGACRSKTPDQNDIAVQLDQLMESLEDLEDEVATSVVETDDLFALKIPDDMDPTTDLNDAPLQYNNLVKEKYIVAEYESKIDFIEELKSVGQYNSYDSDIEQYADVQFENLEGNCSILAKSSWHKKKINGHNSRMIAIDADVDGIPESISYWMAFIEGDDYFYHISSWTLESRKDDFEKEANDILRSFREL